jgi:myo-inositol-1-phosphate synthase
VVRVFCRSRDARARRRRRGGGSTLDFAARAGLRGTQEWLAFYFKSPMAAPGLVPEHDLLIQQKKLKNTLRWLMGEQPITHLGTEYYD